MAVSDSGTNLDLQWDIKLPREKSYEFVMRFEGKLCVYSPSVEQLYTNYSLNFTNNNSRIVVIPDRFAYHDTFNRVPAESVETTPMMVVPGELIGKPGLQLVKRDTNGGIGQQSTPFRQALAKMLSRQSDDKALLPVIVKGDLREFGAEFPCLHLHKITLDKAGSMSDYNRQSMRKAIFAKLALLHAEEMALTKQQAKLTVVTTPAPSPGTPMNARQTTTDTTCEHEPQQQRFVIRLPEGEAVLEYQLTDDAVDFSRTYVPQALRNRGLAEKLVRAGLAWARSEDLTMTASCWYVDKWLQRGASN
ncbi:N-acetyltransferase [Salinispirillum sp. LH 10-3-1]|uniref:N-acetyltransferase n=1 Tax=Salinispirillum sp. LH 10-3-1 TaxID=2952525 RepID=A0AB38YG95_9GAMM